MRLVKVSLPILMIIIGSLFLFSSEVKDFIVKKNIEKNLTKINPKNNEIKVSYDFNSIQNVTTKDVLKASTDSVKESIPVIGHIEIPSVDLKLPIVRGISTNSMLFGAGTLKENQQMGRGNYALASHHMKNHNLLFSPLDRVQIGDLIVLSDRKKIFKYQVIEKKVIKATDVHVIDEIVGKTLVTLITCNSKGNKRLLVVGQLAK